MADKSTNTEAPRSGLYLTGDLADVSATEYREAYKGNKDGRPFEIPAHYEQVLIVITPRVVYRVIIRYDDPAPGHEAAHKCNFVKGIAITVPIKSVGKTAQGVSTVYAG